MANSKNTIQNIPLEGELCMNSLKTEVKPFAGYNEKNTTFYGGTLSPIYDKTTKLFGKNNSYTVFNSKGVPYTIVKMRYVQDGVESYRFMFYKNQKALYNNTWNLYSKTEKLDVPSNTILAAKCPDSTTLYVTSGNGSIVKNGSTIAYHGAKVVTSRCWFRDGRIIIITVGEPDTDRYNTSNVKVFFVDENGLVTSNTFSVADVGVNPFISGVKNRYGGQDYFDVYLVSSSFFIEDTGLIKGDDYRNISAKEIEINYSDSSMAISNTTTIFTENFSNGERIRFITSILPPVYSANLQQYGWRILEGSEDNAKNLYGPDSWSYSDYGHTGNSGYDVGCPLGGYPNEEETIYYQNGSVISIGCCGLPIDACLSYSSNIVTKTSAGDSRFITYRKNDGNWYCYSCYSVEHESQDISADVLKQFVLDGRYIVMKMSRGSVRIYDIETDKIRPETRLDLIISRPPTATIYNASGSGISTTGCVFGGGINAGYMINNSPFVGYLPNPFVLENFPAIGRIKMESSNCVQNYCSVGDTVQSAKYIGKEPQYFGTVYPIDPNGNVVLPISQTAQLIKGYSNNDLVKEGNTVYPLMYYNNNQKTYTYMLLSGMENITNAFSLQGQQYAVDDDNIYAVSFNAGVIQNATAVTYKKNLTFLGTLPTQAVFWSDFNKTFYAFTGDRILSRMFEASDINKIEYVGQNPATLSLWICTDDGIYVLSDKDTFKLNYNSKQVAFYSKNALIVAEGATNNECHAISLYLNDDEQGEMVPVKLQTAYYGLGGEQKAVMDCWYLRLFDKDRTEGYVKVKVNTITDVTRHTEEKTYNISPSDYDDNNIVYIRYQPKYQECVSMQLELETNLGIYSMSLGVNTTDSTAQVSKFNF